MLIYTIAKNDYKKESTVLLSDVFLPPVKSDTFSSVAFGLYGRICEDGGILAHLTERQKLFCEEYLTDRNATRAYKTAYPRIKNVEVARTSGARLLKNENVQKYFSELRDEQSRRTEVTADKIIEELKVVAFAEDVVITGKEKMRALELLGKLFGLFVEKTQTETDNKLKITLEWKEKGEKDDDKATENQ